MADITLPQLGETVTEGTITKWFKKVGDTVAADEPLFEVSTDKVDTEVPSPISGTLTEIRVAEGDTVPVGTVIAVVGVAGAAPVPTPAPVVAAPVVVAPVPTPAPVVAVPAPVVAAPAPTPAPAPVATSNKLLSPVVRRLVAEHGIDVNALVGSGPGSRITREDVLDHIDRNGLNVTPAAAPAPVVAAPAPVVAAPAPVAPAQVVHAPAPAPVARPAVVSSEREQVVALTKIRKLTGSHMIMSKSTSPHAFSVVEVDYANVDRARNANL